MTERRGYFVTGTDTGVGKTVISLGLMQYLQDAGLRVAAMKPVASGCESTPDGLRNADALALQQQASVAHDYAVVNPFAFEPPIAPHIAAAATGAAIEIPEIINNYKELQLSADCVVVEGVGGWRVPIDARQDMADVARQLGLPVILVVAIRLGCLNHALLSQAAIRASGLPFAGWVANTVETGLEASEEVVRSLETRISVPCLGVVPVLCDRHAGAVAGHLCLPSL